MKKNILNFDSRILLSKDMEKEAIKFWISPTKLLKANLLYSFHDINYRRERDNRYNYEFNRTVREFHTICDNHSKILIICKSRNEIFGGYTPLFFRSDDSYGCDNESFLFSINRLKKYSKDSFNNSKSIWRYEDYGPSFHYDLHFSKNKMNVVKFDKTNYLTPSRWVRGDECFRNDDGILLESLEIFQIEEINARNFENRSMRYFLKNKDNNNKIFNDNKDNNIISNSIKIENSNENFIITNTNDRDKNKLKENKNTPLNNMKKRIKNINKDKDIINISKEKSVKIENNKINDKEKKEINNNKKESSIINEKYEIKNKKIDILDIKEKEIKGNKDINIDNNNEKLKEIKDENKFNHQQNQENQESKSIIIISNEKKIKPENKNILIGGSDGGDSDINNKNEVFIENDEKNNSNDLSISEKSDDSVNEVNENCSDREE